MLEGNKIGKNAYCKEEIVEERNFGRIFLKGRDIGRKEHRQEGIK
jgi:hypothetical protein